MIAAAIAVPFLVTTNRDRSAWAANHRLQPTAAAVGLAAAAEAAR